MLKSYSVGLLQSRTSGGEGSEGGEGGAAGGEGGTWRHRVSRDLSSQYSCMLA